MRYIRQLAIGTLAAELLLAAVLLVGLVTPLPGMVEMKIVQSGSMEPVVPVGSLVFIMPQTTYATGDIVTFGSDTKGKIPTTHRIIGTEREAGRLHYQTKGDANEEKDNGLVPFHAVIGKVVLTVPRLGYVLDFARSERGFTFMIVIPASLIILDELLHIYGALRREKRPSLASAHAHDSGLEAPYVPHGSQERRQYVERPRTVARPHSIDGIVVITPRLT